MQFFTRHYLLFFLLLGVFSNKLLATTDPETIEFDEIAIQERLKTLSDEVVSPRYVTAVKGYLKGYLIRNRASAEKILGRTALYFPIFEQYLEEYGLPQGLKYLAIVESALNPQAISRVGAGGLWQFMPATGESLGLQIDSEVDERWDPRKSTEAAMIYLGRQYDRFDDWALALAAYNSGSGRVRRAIKRGRSKDFWQIQRFLPKETRNYVPAFIAVNYLLNYYDLHDLTPDYPDLDIQITETIKIYHAINFYQIVQLTELPLEVIETLNPSYKKGLIPTHQEGHFLTLPKRVMPAFKDYLEAQRPDHAHGSFFDSPVFVAAPSKKQTDANYIKSIYIVKEGETLLTIAREAGVTPHQLRVWNKMRSDAIEPGQELILYFPKSIKRFRPSKPVPMVEAIPTFPLEYLEHESFKAPQLLNLYRQYEYYYVTQKGKPSAIAAQIEGVDYLSLMQLNGWTKDRPLKVGTLIKLRKVNSDQ
ncbi:MAG: transglycosylase SLT domain-containing protein [Saprospiraceae bacterium]